MHKHFKRHWFTQAIYLHIMPNFAPQCMKLLGKIRIWPTVLDWCLPGHFYNCF